MRQLAIVAAVALIGCIPPPKQTGGLGFFDQAGFERRMRILCRLGIGDDPIRSACAAPNVRPGAIAGTSLDRPDPSAQPNQSTKIASESCSKGGDRGTLEAELRLTRETWDWR